MPGAWVNLAVIGLPARVVAVTSSGERFFSAGFLGVIGGGVHPLVDGTAEFCFEILVVFARIAARFCL